MKIFYVTDASLPSKYTHTIHYLKQCQGFADSGHYVELLYSIKDKNAAVTVEDIRSYYHVRNNFFLKGFNTSVFTANRLFYHIKIFFYLIKFKGLIYTRETRVAVYATLLGFKTVLELHLPINPHGVKRSYFWRYLYIKTLKSKRLIKLIVISQSLKKEVEAYTNIEKILVAPDAADIPYTNETLHFNSTYPSKINIGYLGHLYRGKGMEIILETAKQSPDAQFHIVGGTTEDLIYWEKKVQDENVVNIHFYGYVAPKNISKYLNSFDACVLPNKNIVRVSNLKIDIGKYTSPMKMFDYMAHGKAIIASDLPVLREVLNESNAILCDPEDPQAWVDAINLLHKNPDLREKLGKKAFADFEENYTWKKRAERIINSIQK